MPLHLVCECCKCRANYILQLWSISINHKYSNEPIPLCSHFDIIIDNESNVGFLGFGWSNHITLTAIDKHNNESKTIIDKVFNLSLTEYQNYNIFSNKIIFHARVSDYENKFPTCGFYAQDDIDKNEMNENKKTCEVK